MALNLNALSKAVGNLPAPVRHAVLVLIASLLSWFITSDPAPSFATAAATYALGWITPLIKSYGLGRGQQQ